MRERRRRSGGGLSIGCRLGGCALAATAALVLSLGGCAKMNAALGKQWMVVSFSQDTTTAAALQVRAACSHIQNTPPLPLPVHRTPIGVMDGVRFDTTNSSPANLAELQICLQKFKSVVGVNAMDSSDQGG